MLVKLELAPAPGLRRCGALCEKGEFIFVAEVDPNNKVREIDEINNVYASDVEEFGDVSTGGTDNGDEEGGGLFGIPSISGLAALSLLGTVALLRRRR